MSNIVENNKLSNFEESQTPCESLSDSTITKCICGITSDLPYDTSVFINNSTTFYTNFNYLKLDYLLKIISSDESINKLDITDPTILSLCLYFKDPTVQIIFRFLCSPDCHNGTLFVNTNITDIVFNFVKYVCSIRPVIFEFSDHSMGSFFTNWKNDFMEMESPIEILRLTTSGGFKISGTRENFISSVHPTLKQIGDLSSDENVEITFNNMGGTKIFKIHETATNVKVISSGHELYSSTKKIDTLHPELEIPILYPVHCEFDYKLGKIVVSATHWCNLDNVNNEIDLPKLRRYCTEAFGQETTQELDNMLSSINEPNELKRVISSAVRQISSGQPDKKCKCNNFSC